MPHRRRQRFAAACAGALILAMPFIEGTSAHAGEPHAASGPADAGGLGVLAAVMTIGAVYWLTDRAGQKTARRGHADPTITASVSDTAERFTAPRAAHRSTVPSSLLAEPAPARHQSKIAS